MASGIYKILNTVTQKIYIGSAVDIEQRWKAHRGYLKRKKHHSAHLQRAFDLDGEDSFQFSIVELCEEKILLEREQFWMDETKCYDEEVGYNICKRAGSHLGMKRSEETKNKMRGEKNPTSRYTLEEVKLMRDKYENENWSTKKIADIYGFSRGAIKSIVTYRSWNFDGRDIYHKDPAKVSELLKKEDRKGENNLSSKLTNEKVKEMRRLYIEEMVSMIKIAKMFDVSSTLTQQIIKNNIWVDESYTYIKKKDIVGYDSNKLKPEEIKEIVQLYQGGGVTYSDLAKRYKICQMTAHRIVNIISNKETK